MSLTADQISAINRVLSNIGPEAVNHSYCKHLFNVHRWIVAYGGKEDEAAKVLRRHLNIREIMSIDNLPEEEGEDIDEQAELYAPLDILGVNHPDDNKVLILEQSGRIDINGMVENLRTTRFMRAKFRMMERLHRRVRAEEERTKKQSGGMLIMDLEGLSFSTTLLSVLAGPYRIMWGTLFEQYPQLIQSIIIINAPKFVNILYQTCIPFIPSDYKEKIVISSNESNTTLLKYIHPSCLPSELGGEQDIESSGEFVQITSPITTPLSPFPIAEPIDIELQTLTIPAGGSTEQKFYWEKGTKIEFFLQHNQEFTLFTYYSLHDTNDESQRREIYAGCERPALPQIDHWTWNIPYTGFYYMRYGNEKAWLFSVSVSYQFFQIVEGKTKQEANPISTRTL